MNLKLNLCKMFCIHFKFILIFLIILHIHPAYGQDLFSGRSSNNARPNFGSSYGSSFAGNRYEPVMTEELIVARERLMYHYNMTDFTSITQSKPIHDQPLPFRLPFFGFAFTYAYIQKDGYLGFNKGLLSYSYPLKFPVKPNDPLAEEDPSLIASWFAQQEIPTKVPEAGVYFKMVNLANEKNQTLKDRLILDFREGMIGAADFQPRFALIITWRNMTFVNKRPETEMKTNTYQMILATDEIRTYAMFNYEKIDWITSLDNYDGMKGSPAYIGFNAGNTTRTFEFRPYSQFQRISTLTDGGFGNNLRGRYFFQIDEEVWPGACIDKELDPDLPDRMPLTFFPRWGHMLGGTLVNVTGPCLQPEMIITCNFDNWKVPAVYRSPNHASCISPPVQYHGYIDLSLTVNDKTIFLGRYYVQPPDVVYETIKVINDKDREEDPDEILIKWDPFKISWNLDASIKILLYGYRESTTLYPKLTYIETLAENIKLDAREYRINVEEQRQKWNPGLTDLTFGFIAINLTDPSALGDGIKNSPTLWSRPMPLAWYFKKQWEYNFGYGGQWKDHFCQAWNDREEKGDRFATTLFQCPCTKEQALLDRGRFSPDLECNIIDRKCDTYHRGAQHCVRSARPSIGGSGQTCCYDDQIELLQTADTMYGGRPSRAFIYGKHPFKMRMMIPSLSHWVHDVMPFYFCCKWQSEEDNSDSCQTYNFWRTSQDCSSYKPPGVASIFGDPHLLTFDNNSYTFNGRGEFVLVHADNPMHKLDIQARFEQVPRKLRIDHVINATQLTAIAARDNQSATVEFRIRPSAARWRYQMYTIVDNEYVFFWDSSLRVQHFRGVSLYQPAGIQNMSHIIAMFDSGAGVEVMTTEGHMTARFYLPRTYMNNTRGLLGFYDGDKRNDFRPPIGNTYSTIAYDQSNLRDLHEFGMKWRVKEGADVPGIGSSLFFHNSFTFAHFDDPRFEPEMEFPPKLPDDKRYLEAEMNNICSDSNECRYDYLMTMDTSFARISKQHQTWALEINQYVNRTVTRCPALQKPKHGRKSENRYWPGTLVRFSCDEGYRLTGYEIRQCREDGLWSWGEEAECISEGWWAGQISLVVLGILLPILIVIGCCVFCMISQRKSGEEHYTGEKKTNRKFPELPPTKSYSQVGQNDDETLPMKTQLMPSRFESSTEVEV